MRAVRAVAGAELRRFLRDRSNIFFVFLFPVLLIALLGAQFGGDAPAGRVVVSGPAGDLRTDLVAALEAEGMEVDLAAAADARELLARARVDVGVFVPADATGEAVTLRVLRASRPTAQVAVQEVRAAIRTVAAERAQVAALVGAGVPAATAPELLEAAAARTPAARVVVTDSDAVAQELSGLGRFDLGAVTQTLLFVFLTSLAGSATLIQARRYGVVARALAAPVTAFQAVAGQALGRFAIALVQGGYLVLGTAVLFGVRWGSWPLVLLTLALFCAVAAAAAMVVGSLLDNDRAASGVGVGAGMVLGALGGCMTPLDFFPDWLRTVAHVTPHAWGYDVFAALQRHDASLGEVLPELGVLAAMAGLLLVAGAWLLQRSLARGL